MGGTSRVGLRKAAGYVLALGMDESTDSFQDENEHMRIVSLAAAAQTSMQPELLGTLTHLMPCCALP